MYSLRQARNRFFSPSALENVTLQTQGARRTLVSAPRPNGGPLLSRRSDRELPSLSSHRRWMRTIPIFMAIIGGSSLAIFNYQKSSSSVVSSTLYALRTSPAAREVLGDEIYFAQKIPWISGVMNQLKGHIDISFWVQGTQGKGKMRFKSVRPNRMGYVRMIFSFFFFFFFY